MSAKHSTGNGRGIPAVSYIRMSSDQQDASPKQQRAEVAKLAERNGFHLVGEYCDDAISGDRTDKRKAFQRMIADSATGKFKAILCWDQDRFGRFDSVEAGFWIHPLRKAGVKLVTVAQGTVDWNTFAGRLIYNVQQEGKHAFLRDLSRNVLRGRIAAAKRGEWLSPRPMGYRVENKRLVVGDQQDVATVRGMFADYLNGHSLRAIAVKLNENGITTRRRNLWSASGVKAVLENPAYVGTYTWANRQSGKYHVVQCCEISGDVSRGWNDDVFVIEDNHPAIIERRVFDAVQRRLGERQKSTTPHQDGGNFALPGFLRCGKCGGKMYGKTEGDTVRYHCSANRDNGLCDLNATGQAELLSTVLAAIESWMTPKTVDRLRSILTRKVRDRSTASGVDDLRKRLTQVESQLTTARRNMALADGDDLRREYEVAVRELRSERDRLTASIQTAEKSPGRTGNDADQRVEKAIETLSRLRERVTAAPVVTQRELLRNCIEKVESWSVRNTPTGRFHLQKIRVHLRPDMWFSDADKLSSTLDSTS